MSAIGDANRRRGQVGARHRRAPADLSDQSYVSTPWVWICMHCREAFPTESTVITLDHVRVGDDANDRRTHTTSEFDLANLTDLTESPRTAGMYVDLNDGSYAYGIAAFMVVPHLGLGLVLTYCRRCHGMEPSPADQGRDGWARWSASKDRAHAVKAFTDWIQTVDAITYTSPRPFDTPPPRWFEHPRDARVGDVRLRDIIEWNDLVIEVHGMRRKNGETVFTGYSWANRECIGEDSTPPLHDGGMIRILGECPRPRE